MVKGATKYLVRLFGAIGLLLFALIPFGAWRLSQGPVHLDFLTPYIEQALSSKEGKFSISLKTTILTWGEGVRPVDIRAVDLKIKGSGDEVLASIPELSLSFSAHALFKGVIAPKRIEFIRPEIRLLRTTDGSFQYGLDKIDEDIEATLSGDISCGADGCKGVPVRELVSLLEGEGATRYLSFVGLSNARVIIEDQALEAVWDFSEVDFEISRDMLGIKAVGSMYLEMADTKVRIRPLISYDFSDRLINSTIHFDDINFSKLANSLPLYDELTKISMDLSGNIKTKIKLFDDKKMTRRIGVNNVEDLSFEIKGGSGAFYLPKPIDTTYEVTSLSAKAHFTESLEKLIVDYVDLKSEEPNALLKAEISGVSEAIKQKSAEPIKIVLNADVGNMPITRLPEYWPSSIGSNAHSWVKNNMKDGKVTAAHYQIDFEGKKDLKDPLIVKKIDGRARVEGTTVNYIDNLPEVKNASGVVMFALDKVDINIDGGQVYNLRIPEGKLSFFDLWEEQPKASISLNINGPVADKLRIIDHRPLGYASKLGVVPKKIGGVSKSKVNFDFPLKENLSVDDVKVLVESQIQKGFIPKAILDKDVSDGLFELSVDNRKIILSGTAVLEGTPVSLEWEERFNKKPFSSKYHILTEIDDEGRDRLGLNFTPFSDRYITGSAVADLVVTEHANGAGFIGVQLDLTSANLKVPEMSFKKERGVPANASISGRFKEKHMEEISKFRLTSGDNLSVLGNIDFAKDNKIKYLRFDECIMGRTNASAIVKVNPDKIKIDIAGKSVDLDGFIGEASWIKDRSKKDKVKVIKPLSFNMAVNKAWVSSDGWLENLGASVEESTEGKLSGEIVGGVGDEKNVRISFLPSKDDGYLFSATSENAGGTLRAFGAMKNARSGNLEINGSVDRFGNAKGLATIKNYKVVKAPLLAQLLSVATLTGAVDVLKGEGIVFDDLELPFELNGSRFIIGEARTAGTSLGLTANGYIDAKENKIELEGMIVPAYAVNSVLGKIPVIGKLFVGQEGGGLFAATYSVKGDRKKPEIVVNPLSALAPGILRNLFGLGSVSEDKIKQKK